MNRFVIGAVAMLAATGAQADDLRGILMSVGRSEGLTAMWLDAMPRIATECLFKLNRANLSIRVSMMRDLSDVMLRDSETAVAMGQKPDLVWSHWKEDVYDKEGPAQGCGLALDLWGDTGTMYPGLLSSE